MQKYAENVQKCIHVQIYVLALYMHFVHVCFCESNN